MPGSSQSRRHKMKASGAFATHLSIFDDDIKFDVDQEDGVAGERQVPPSVLRSATKPSQGGDEGKEGGRGVGGEAGADPPPAKVRRKCGRPRNPIPRHKRESHISAEYRRRGKIQNGFQALKNLLPKGGETSSGRDSKADILFKAVDYARKAEVDMEKDEKQISELRGEIKQLQAELEDYQRAMPVASLFPETSRDMDAMFEDYVTLHSQPNWRSWIFSLLARPLFQSFRASVGGSSLEELARSFQAWAEQHLSLQSLRSVVCGALRHMGSENSHPTESAHFHTEATPIHHGHVFEETAVLDPTYHSPTSHSQHSSVSCHDDVGCVQSLTASLEEDSLHHESLIQICQSLLPIDQLKKEVLAHHDPPHSDPDHAPYVNAFHSHHYYDHVDSSFQPMAPCYTSL